MPFAATTAAWHTLEGIQGFCRGVRHCCSSALITQQLPQKNPIVLLSMFWKHSELVMLTDRSPTCCCFPLGGIGEEGEQSQLSTSVWSKTVYGVYAGKQLRKSGAECSQQEQLFESFFFHSLSQNMEVNAAELKGSQNFLK